MKRLLLVAVSLFLASSLASAQQPMRIRGTITALDGDMLSVKSRDGEVMQLHLAPNVGVAVAKAITLADLKPGTYVASAAIKRADGTLVAKDVHTIPPQAPAGQTPWDLEPGSTMINANLAGAVEISGGNEITLQYKDGSQKILVPPGTPILTYVPGDRSALKPGEWIVVLAATRQPDGTILVPRLQVGKDGVKPAH